MIPQNVAPLNFKVLVVMMVLWIYACHPTCQVAYIKYMCPLNVNRVHLKVVLKLNKIYELAENKTCKGKNKSLVHIYRDTFIHK